MAKIAMHLKAIDYPHNSTGLKFPAGSKIELEKSRFVKENWNITAKARRLLSIEPLVIAHELYLPMHHE